GGGKHGQRMPGEHVAHGQHKHRQAQDEAAPEAALHLLQLGRWALIERGYPWLQGHATLGTAARYITVDLWIHRTDVLDLGARRRGNRGRWRHVPGRTMLQIVLGISLESLETGARAEVVRLTFMRVRTGRRGGIDRHAAHRVD